MFTYLSTFFYGLHSSNFLHEKLYFWVYMAWFWHSSLRKTPWNFIILWWSCFYKAEPPIYLHSIFQFCSLKYRAWWTGFLVYFKLEFYRLQKAEKPAYQTGYFKLENCKNQVQMDSLEGKSSNWIFQTGEL